MKKQNLNINVSCILNSTSFSQLDSSTWNIDMQELEYNPSKKDMTDAKIHHLLAEELCKPYRRVRVIFLHFFSFLDGKFTVHAKTMFCWLYHNSWRVTVATVCVCIFSLLSFLENERHVFVMSLSCVFMFLCMHTGTLKWLHLCTTHVWVCIYMYATFILLTPWFQFTAFSSQHLYL